MAKKEKTAAQAEPEESSEVYLNYYLTVNFMENCGVKKVVIKQSGKPGGGPPPPPPGGGS